MVQKGLSLKRESGRISRKEKDEFFDMREKEGNVTRFNNWKVLRGCCPESRYFVMIPFKDEIVQLTMRRITPKNVPEI